MESHTTGNLSENITGTRWFLLQKLNQFPQPVDSKPVCVVTFCCGGILIITKKF